MASWNGAASMLPSTMVCCLRMVLGERCLPATPPTAQWLASAHHQATPCQTHLRRCSAVASSPPDPTPPVRLARRRLARSVKHHQPAPRGPRLDQAGQQSRMSLDRAFQRATRTEPAIRAFMDAVLSYPDDVVPDRGVWDHTREHRRPPAADQPKTPQRPEGHGPRRTGWAGR